MAALATDFLAFDDSPGGERLRRYDLESGRGLSRSLDDLRKHRRSPLPVVSGPLSVVGCEAEALTEAISPNEPTAVSENAPNEPAAAHEHAPNEPNVAQINAKNESIRAYENATSEPKLAADRSPRGDVELDNSGESYWQGVARWKAAREERTRQLNEEARREAADAMATRRAFRRARRSKNCKTGAQPKPGTAQGIGSFEAGIRSSALEPNSVRLREKTTDYTQSAAVSSVVIHHEGSIHE